MIDAWPSRRLEAGRTLHEPGPLGLVASPELVRLVALLQADLLAVLSGAALAEPCASGCSAACFARTARELGAILLKPAWWYAWRP